MTRPKQPRYPGRDESRRAKRAHRKTDPDRHPGK